MERTEQLAALREGRIHLGLFPCMGAPLERGLDSITVWSCPMVAVLPTGHALTEKSKGCGKKMDIRLLAGDALIIPSSEGSPGYGERLDQIFMAAGFHPASVRAVDGAENVLSMVAAGYGVSILPDVLATGSNPACIKKPLRAPVEPRELKLLWRRQATTDAVKNFLTVARRCSEEVH